MLKYVYAVAMAALFLIALAFLVQAASPITPLAADFYEKLNVAGVTGFATLLAHIIHIRIWQPGSTSMKNTLRLQHM